MTATLEWRKVRRTGLLPAGLGGCALAAAVPICNMALRAETYLSQPGGALQILLDANWPVMAMINALLVVLGASLFYHIEFAGNAMVKMRTLPLRETSLFLHKFAWLAAACACVLGVEFLGLGFCARHWFGAGAELAAEVAKNWGFSILMLQPALSLALLVSSGPSGTPIPLSGRRQPMRRRLLPGKPSTLRLNCLRESRRQKNVSPPWRVPCWL